MKIDFHTHGKLAKKMPFSIEYTSFLFREAQKAGLDALCLTEHFNTLGFEQIYEYIEKTYPRQGDSFMAEGVRVFPGMEIDVREGAHILAIGTLENILALSQILKPHHEKKNFLPFSRLMEIAQAYEVLLGAAHPFREGSKLPWIPAKHLKKLDFIDLNGKDCAVKGALAREEVAKLAQALKLPVMAGSDTHQSFQYGCIYNQFERECTTVAELKACIIAEAYEIQVQEYIQFKVKTAGILKKALKEIHACGGDYVSVLTAEE